MWTLGTLKTKKVKLDLSSSRQADFYATQIWNDDIELVNLVEHVNWNDLDFQFIVCKSCACVGCKPRDWVEIKRTGSMVLIMPAFTRLREASKQMRDEYLPPSYLLERGVIYINRESYESRLCQIAPFPKFETLPPLPAWEASKIFQLEAQNRVLGQILNPSELYKDIVIASSEGNFMEQTSALISLVDNLSKATHTVNFRGITEADQIISLYLDISGYPEWAALSYDGSRYSLYLKPGYIIE
jgi:hypothetical protein